MATAKKAQTPDQAAGEDGDASGRRMSGAEFARLRASLGKSQRELAGLLGVSLKAVESYEQGWRNVPAHVERILYFLLFKLNESEIEAEEPCWASMNCPTEKRDKCVAYVAKEGRFCWFFTGRLCQTAKPSAASGEAVAGADASADDRGCYACSVFSSMLAKVEGGKS
jgi:transcriptional regulator with XRE-family HTH domain